MIDDITASPGETVTRAVRVKNDALGEVKLKMSIYDVEPGDDTGFPKYLTKSPESTLANWINPNLSSEIILKGGETADVPLIIAVPKMPPRRPLCGRRIWICQYDRAGRSFCRGFRPDSGQFGA